MKIVNTLQDKVIAYAAIFLIVVFSISLYRSLGRVHLVQTEINKKKAEIAEVQKETDDLKNQLARAQKPEFIEGEIRNKLGLVKTGEVVVVLPDAEEVKKLSPVIPEDQEVPIDPNWKRWLKLFI